MSGKNLLSLSQFALAARNSIHITRIVSSRPILHRVAQIACSRFCWNLLMPAPRRSGFILLASAASHANPVEQIYTPAPILLQETSHPLPSLMCAHSSSFSSSTTTTTPLPPRDARQRVTAARTAA